MREDSGSVRNLVIGMLLIAAPFGGLSVAFAIASGLQRAGVLAVRLSGRSPRDIMIVGLAALSILTPWTITVAVANLHQLFGWTNPLAWVLAVGLVLFVMESARPYHGLALAAAGAALLAWLGWSAFVLSTLSFNKLPFTFMPVDLISTGWFAGLIGWVVAVEAFAARGAREPKPAQSKDVWPLAVVPGMGLVRLGFAGRGRVWLAAAVLVVAFIGISAVNDSEFAYWAHYDTTPPDRGRLDVLLGAAALVLVLLASWFDTWRSLRRREIMGDWLARVRRRSQSESR